MQLLVEEGGRSLKFRFSSETLALALQGEALNVERRRSLAQEGEALAFKERNLVLQGKSITLQGQTLVLQVQALAQQGRQV